MRIKLNREIVKFILLVLTLVLLGTSVLKIVEYFDKGNALDFLSGFNHKSITIDGVKYEKKPSLETFLIIGVDKYEAHNANHGYSNSHKADFLVLFVLDNKNDCYTALQLNRDTMTKIQILGERGEKTGEFVGQLALSNTYGKGGHDSCRNTVDAVENLLFGINIDHYLSLTMDAIVEINDFVGGVTVKVLEDMTSLSPEMQKDAEITLHGALTLDYIGAADNGNVSRAERQAQYFRELQKQLSGKDFGSQELLSIAEKLSDCVVSNCTATRFLSLYEKICTYQNNGFVSLDGETVLGGDFSEFYPDKENLKQTVISLFCKPE